MRLLVVLLLAFSGCLYSYTLVYDLYTAGFKTGNAYLYSHDDSLLVKFRVAPVPFFNYDYTIECLLDKNRVSYRENIIEIINGKTNLFDYSQTGGDFIRTNRTMNAPPMVFTNRWKPGKSLSLFVLLDRFVRLFPDAALDHIIFIREQNDQFKVIGPENGYWRIKEVNDQYIFLIHYVLLSGWRVPDAINIERYRFFGINWNIIKLKLHSFSIDDDSDMKE